MANYSIIKRTLFFFFTANVITSSFAQVDTTKNVFLDEFIHIEKMVDKAYSKAKFSTGTHLQIADSSAISLLQNSSLSEYLQQNSAVFIKESGNGMLSSISLRGTASSHTSVSWNGLNINPLTMGQVDFSQLPLFFFEKVAIHQGGESALYGSGAIGGSILLGAASEYHRTWNGEVMQSLGSYGYSFSGIKIKGGTEKIQTRTAFMYSRCDNDFDIEYETYSGKEKEKQNNASFWNYGLLHDFSWKISEKNELSFNAWHTYYYREIQPSIQNNKNKDYYDSLSNRDTRLLLSFKRKSKVSLVSRVAYVNEHQENNDDVIASNNLILSTEADYYWKHLSFKAGASAQYIVPEVYSYNSGIREWRGDVFLLSKWRPFSFWELSLNMRQSFVEDISVPFTPSVGTSVRVLKNRENDLRLRSNLSRSFKVPTLNDRYWGGLDNRYLKPEDGVNMEIGVDYLFKTKRYNLYINTSVYYNEVENWIMWMPRGEIWKPQNIDKVLAKGVESSLKQQFEYRKWQTSLSLNYSYTHTSILAGFEDMAPFRNRQVPLLPKHNLNVLLHLGYADFFSNATVNFVGERSTSNIFDKMEPFSTTSLSAGYNFRIRTQILSLSMHLNNLFDQIYETVPYKAMPLRNWKVSLKWIF